MATVEDVEARWMATISALQADIADIKTQMRHFKLSELQRASEAVADIQEAVRADRDQHADANACMAQEAVDLKSNIIEMKRHLDDRTSEIIEKDTSALDASATPKMTGTRER